MAVKKPDIQALTAAKDIKKLTKALSFKSDAAVRAEAAGALGSVGGVPALKSLVSTIENEKEELDVRSAACSAAGNICSKLISENSKIATESLSRSDQRKRKKDMDAIESARKALKNQMDNGPQDLSIVAARAFMSLPITETSVFDGSVSENAFSFSAPAAEETKEEPAAEEDSPAEESPAGEQAEETEEEPAAEEDSPAEESPAADQAEETEDKPAAEEDSPAEESPAAEQAEETEVEPAAEEDSPAEESPAAEDDSPAEATTPFKSSFQPEDVNLDEPVEIAPDTYWVGRREGSSLERNIYLRIFRKGDKVLNLLIDPGPPEDLTPLVEKLSILIGSIRNLHIMFLNHQDPDVAFNAGHIQKLNPNCIVLCSEDSWRLVKFYGLDEQMYKPVESFMHRRTDLNTGHRISFIPTPFCHFRGACMLYDHETGVLFSGDFLGGLSSSPDLYASDESWEGISAFHQIYMPSKTALSHAVSNVREMETMPTVIAPQHGSVIRDNFVEDFLQRVDKLEVGLDLFLKEHFKQNCISALNELLGELGQILDPSIISDALSAFRTDGSFPDVITTGDTGIAEIKADGQYAVELFLKNLREKTPAEKLDLADVTILKVLASWEIPLPEFIKGASTDIESLFS